MKTTIASIVTLAATTLTLSALQPAAAQEYYEDDSYQYEGQQSGYQNQGYQGGQQGGYQNNGNQFGQSSNPSGSQVVQLIDHKSPYGPMVAFEHAIPSGWQANGQVTWIQREYYPGCGYDDNYYKWSARSRDGRQELGYWPQVVYSGVKTQYPIGNPMKGCDNVFVRDPKAFLTDHINRVRPGSRIQSYRPPTPQISAQLQQALPPTQRIAQDTIGSWGIITAQFVITYEENGVSFDEYLVAIAIIYDLKTTGSMASETQITAVLPTYYMRAPTGQLDEKTAMAYGDSMRANPNYLQMLKSISDVKAKKNAQRMLAQSKAAIAASRNVVSSAGSTDGSVADIMEAGRNKRNAISDASQTRMAASAGGIARYTDPQSNTGYFETDVGVGDRVFRQDDGSTVVTGDYFYNEGVQLAPAQ